VTVLRYIIAILLFFHLLYGEGKRYYPTACCPAYHNLKHTKNNGNIRLDPRQIYVVQRHYKNQYLIRVEGASPVQRWVDDSCLVPQSALNVTPATCEVKPIEVEGSSEHTKKYYKNNIQKYENSGVSAKNILALSWHNAFCETHRKKKECQREWKSLFGKSKGTDRFVLHGLWPQPKSRVYCGVERRYITADRYGQWNRLPEPKLSKETKSGLKEVMPGTDSNLHRHEWIKHGTCYGTDAERYFKHAVTLAKEVENSEVAHFFQAHTGRRIGIEKVRALFDRSFGRGAGAHVELRCRNGLITELWLHLGEGDSNLSRMLQTGKRVQSRCRYGIVDGK